jgi:hypothetical protein
MFDLEKAIAEWRRQMLAAGLKTPTPLDELESHLREDMRVLLSAGKPEAEAFQLAVSRLGKPGPLRTEFNKLKKPRCWPVTIGFWLYAVGMILMAVSIANSMSIRLWVGASKMGLLPNPLLLYAHIVSLTAGYCAAFLAGYFGVLYVCYRFFHALSPAREQSLVRAVFLFSHLAAGLVIAGMALGMLWSRQHLGGYFGGSLREMATGRVTFWLIALLVMQRIGRVSKRDTMLMCVAVNVVVGLAWFEPFILDDRTASYWPLAVFVGLNLVFLAIGMLPVHQEVES